MAVIDESWYTRPESGIRDRLAAGGIIVRKDESGKLWIALTTGEDIKVTTAYILPKGGVDKGEEIETAARREIEEEAGFSQLQLVEKLGIRERLSFDKTRWTTTHYFLYTTNETEPQPTEVGRGYVTHWFDFSKPLPPLFWPEQAALVETHRERILALAVS
ncbi:MAG: NUDIX domain-containing protein [Armatimonadetes bacterium]|nr:NUDIX domain-containing protein [Armatimonadota bacterium]